MPLIHCGYGLGQGAIAADPGDVGRYGHSLNTSPREKAGTPDVVPAIFGFVARVLLQDRNDRDDSSREVGDHGPSRQLGL
jgi:hypothetical protein